MKTVEVVAKAIYDEPYGQELCSSEMNDCQVMAVRAVKALREGALERAIIAHKNPNWMLKDIVDAILGEEV